MYLTSCYNHINGLRTSGITATKKLNKQYREFLAFLSSKLQALVGCDIIDRMVELGSDVTRLLDRPVDNSYTERRQCPEDGRKLIAKMTVKGQNKLKDWKTVTLTLK